MMAELINRRWRRFHKAIVALGASVLAGCAGMPIDQIELMPAPDVYGDGMLNPLPEYSPFDEIPYNGILYATDRAPATADDREKYYLNDRGQILRVGVAAIEVGEKKFTWEQAREISMLKSRTEKYPIRVTNADEWGVLGSTVPFWIDLDLSTDGNPPPDANERFAGAINAQLARSKKKDVYIYVHGYKVVYENPVLVSAELWHFLGYDGAFIAYAWPSTPSKFAYIKDSDTSGGFARNFRMLLEVVAEKTDVERIHVIGYSNGTRLVTRALEQLALINQGKTADEIFAELHLGNVILVGSDLDRGVFASYVADRLFDVPQHLTIYMSQYDKALGVSQFLTRRQRLGQMWGGAGGEMDPNARNALIKYKNRLSFINVSDAEGAGTGNGHGYFRSSPWASSDVLVSIYYDLPPGQRGLITRLWQSIRAVDPEFSEDLEAFMQRQTAD